MAGKSNKRTSREAQADCTMKFLFNAARLCSDAGNDVIASELLRKLRRVSREEDTPVDPVVNALVCRRCSALLKRGYATRICPSCGRIRPKKRLLGPRLSIQSAIKAKQHPAEPNPISKTKQQKPEAPTKAKRKVKLSDMLSKIKDTTPKKAKKGKSKEPSLEHFLRMVC